MGKYDEKVLCVRNFLRDKTNKFSMLRILHESGLTDEQVDIFLRLYLKGHSRGKVAMDLFCNTCTISRHVKKGSHKVYQYLIECNKFATI